MIESIVCLLLAIGNSFFDAFVFMFGWNHIISKIGFPSIPYIVAIGLCVFISYVRHYDDDDDCEDDDKKARIERVRHRVVENIAHNIIYIVLFVIISWFM